MVSHATSCSVYSLSLIHLLSPPLFPYLSLVKGKIGVMRRMEVNSRNQSRQNEHGTLVDLSKKIFLRYGFRERSG